MKHLVALLAAFLLTGLSFSATAQAQGAGSTQRQVRFDGLDLSTPQGMKALHRRLEHAANAVCVDVTGPSRAGLVDPTCKAAALVEANRQLAHVAHLKGNQ